MQFKDIKSEEYFFNQATNFLLIKHWYTKGVSIFLFDPLKDIGSETILDDAKGGTIKPKRVAG